MSSIEGGCLCGSTRLRIEGALLHPCYCHCRSCRQATGAPFVAWATFPLHGVAVARGSLTTYRSSERVQRGFCAICGSALTYAHDARPDHIDVTIVSLDDPALIAPQFHIWTSHKLPWVVIADELPQFPEWRHANE